MPGGIWKQQNKVRPGAYINFIPVTKGFTSIGTRGIMTLPALMGWGPVGGVIELTGTELANGTCVKKIGYTAFEPESLIFREALRYCPKCLIYRADAGGTVASFTDTEMEGTPHNIAIAAKYAGVCGNRISVIFTPTDELRTKIKVETYYNGYLKDTQIVSTLADLIANDWAVFTGSTGKPPSMTGTLTNGANGTITDDTAYAAYLTAIGSMDWNTMAIPSSNATVKSTIKTFITNLRDTLGRKVQAVMYDYQADYEGIISVKQGYKNSAGETITALNFTITAASMTAGASINQSNTYRQLEDATEIVGSLTDAEIEEALGEGQFVLSNRLDGVIVVEQDINTLTTFGVEKSYAFSKNRVIRVLDQLNTDIGLTFQKYYIGKVDNNDRGRNLFKADLIKLHKNYQNIGAIQNFDIKDIIVYQGEAIDSVVVDDYIQPVDSMEKLYMTIFVG